MLERIEQDANIGSSVIKHDIGSSVIEHAMLSASSPMVRPMTTVEITARFE